MTNRYEEWPDQRLSDEELLMAIQPTHDKKVGWYLTAYQRSMLMGHIYALTSELQRRDRATGED